MRQGRWLKFALSLAALALVQAAPAVAQSIGNAQSITNQVDGILRGNTRSLAVGSDVFSNEVVRTGDAASAQLVFLDATNLSVGPRSLVTLDRFVYNPDRNTGRVVVRASRGIFRFVTGSQPSRDYTVQTPVATIGVRGTVFDLLVRADRTTVVLIEGAVVVTARGGGTVTLTVPGTAVTVYAGGRIDGPRPWTGPIFDTASNAQFPYFGDVPTALAGGGGLPPGRFHFGLVGGGSWLAHIPTTSSSGFYTGNTESSLTTMVGGSIFYDFATIGSQPVPFGSYVISAGLVVDYMHGASMHWHGGCGGFACDGSGTLNELNYIGELKVTTPLPGNNSINGYIGAGGSTFWPTGTPTGAGGPAFEGSATAAAVRIGWGVDHRFDQNWSAGFKAGVQFTGSTEYDTTLAGEHFIFDHKTEAIFGLTLMYTP